jgi:chaperonin GroEL (HSP60 family)
MARHTRIRNLKIQATFFDYAFGGSDKMMELENKKVELENRKIELEMKKLELETTKLELETQELQQNKELELQRIETSMKMRSMMFRLLVLLITSSFTSVYILGSQLKDGLLGRTTAFNTVVTDSVKRLRSQYLI